VRQINEGFAALDLGARRPFARSLPALVRHFPDMRPQRKNGKKGFGSVNKEPFRMIRSRKNGLSFFQFDKMTAYPQLRHGIFTRQNGCSLPPFNSLNTSFGVGDDPECVTRNRLAIQSSLDARRMMFARQVHGIGVLVVSNENDAQALQGMDRPPTVDALVTNLRQRFLTVQVADCQPVLLYDTNRQVVANVHAGWRGSIGDIIGRTVRKIRDTFRSDPGDIVAGIGPSLGPCCAEFRNYRREIPRHFWAYKNDDHHFDFWAISRDQLVTAGIRAENIHLSGICTRCNPELFFSYRRAGTTGRFAAVIGLH
jgi:YfiH family protein